MSAFFSNIVGLVQPYSMSLLSETEKKKSTQICSQSKNTQTVPCYLDDCGFVVEPEVRQLDSSSSILLSQDCFGYSLFITALFIIARTWKQPRCPSADEWIRKLWYICTMEYYSAIKENTFESVPMRWMKLEPVIQSEVSQKEKHQYSMLTHIFWI